MTLPLAGRTIAIAESRQVEELAAMLAKEGATPFCCPLLGILDNPDSAPVIRWLQFLVAGEFDFVIFLTGEGVRRLVGFADREGLRVEVLAALAKTIIVIRGPKPAQALKELSLQAAVVAKMPTTEGVISSLRSADIATQSVGLQLYSSEISPLKQFLTSQGCRIQSVLPYIYAPVSDADQVVKMIDGLAVGEIHMLILTSSPQINRLLEVAAETGRQQILADGLRKAKIGAIGPIVAETLRANGIRVDVVPAKGFVMKNLVRQIKKHLGSE